MKTIFDTNIWVALFNENDAHHDKAKQLFLQNDDINLPEYIILETTTILQIRASKQIANQFAQMIIATEGIEILYATDSFFHAVLTLFQQQENKKLSFVDCALLQLSANYKIYTFDEALEKSIDATIYLDQNQA